MKTQTLCVNLTVTLALTCLGGSARANCIDDAKHTAKADLQVFGPACDQNRVNNTNSVRNNLDLEDDEWSGRGTTCNTSAELAKIVNSYLLIVGGIDFVRLPNDNGNDVLLFIGSETFHAGGVPVSGQPGFFSPDGDYMELITSSERDGWHDHLRHQAIDPNDPPGFTTYADFHPEHLAGAQDLIRLTCNSYDSPTSFGRVDNAEPVSRAATLLHEGGHAYENEHFSSVDDGSGCGHAACPGDHPSVGACGANFECDQFNPHTLGPVGSMNNIAEDDIGAGFLGQNVVHRPYQVAVEFSCDLVDTPTPGISLTLRELAAQNADFMGVNDFVNGPMPACFALTFGQHIPACTTKGAAQCDEVLQCGAGQVCNPQTGCCFTPPAKCSIPGNPSCDGTCLCDQATDCCIITK
jgi:hypothetical protein